MGIPVLVLGRSGTGKSTSLRNFKGNELGLINVLGKPLPFRNEFKYIVTAEYPKIKKAIFEAQLNTLVVDDAGYLITSEFIRRGKEKGYEKFTDLATNFYDLIDFIQHQVPDEKIVYLMMHEDEKDGGFIVPKTIGRLLDEKICIEGMFTIVLRSRKIDDKYVFSTQTDGYDVAKTPIDMFESQHIDNDLKTITETIRRFYNL